MNIIQNIITGLIALTLVLNGLIGGFYLLFKGIDTNSNDEKELSPLFLKLLVVFQVPIFLIGIAYYQINIAQTNLWIVLSIVIMLAIMVFILLGFFNDWRWALYVALGGLVIFIICFIYSVYGYTKGEQISRGQNIARLYGLHGLCSMLGVLCLSISTAGIFGYFKSNLSKITNAIVSAAIPICELIICVMIFRFTKSGSNGIICQEKTLFMLTSVAVISFIVSIFYLIVIVSGNTSSPWQQAVAISGAIAIILNLFVIGHFLVSIDSGASVMSSKINALGTYVFDPKIAKLLMLGIVFTFFACVLSMLPVKGWQNELYYALSGLTALPLLIVPGVFTTENVCILIASAVAAGLVVAGLCLLYQNVEWQNWLGTGLGLAGFLGIGGITLLAHTSNPNQSKHIADIIDKLHTGKPFWDVLLIVCTIIIVAFAWLYLAGLLSNACIFSTNFINTWLTVSTITSVLQIGIYLLSNSPIKLHSAKWWILCALFIVMMVLSVICLLDIWLEWFKNPGQCVSVITAFVTLAQMGCLLIVCLGEAANPEIYPGLFLKAGVALVSTLPALIGVGYLLIRFCKSDIGVADPESWKVCAIMQLLMYGVGALYYARNQFALDFFVMLLVFIASIVILGLGLFWGQKNYLVYVGVAVFEILIIIIMVCANTTNIYLISSMIVPILFIATISLLGYFDTDTSKFQARLYICLALPALITLFGSLLSCLDKNPNNNGGQLCALFLFMLLVAVIGICCAANNNVQTNNAQTIECGLLCAVALLINILISGMMFVFDYRATPSQILAPQTVQFILVLLGCMTFIVLLFLSVAKNWSIEFYYAFAVMIAFCVMVVPSVLTEEPGFVHFIVTFFGAAALATGLVLIRQSDTGAQWGGAASGGAGVITLIACLCCIGSGKIEGKNAGGKQVQSVISSFFLPKGTKVYWCSNEKATDKGDQKKENVQENRLKVVNNILKVLAVFFKIFTWLWFVGFASTLFSSTTTKAIHIVGDIFALLMISVYFCTDLFFKYKLPLPCCQGEWCLWVSYFVLWLIALALTVLGMVDLYTKWTLPLDGASWFSFAALLVECLCLVTLICINNPQFKIIKQRDNVVKVARSGPVLLGRTGGNSGKPSR